MKGKLMKTISPIFSPIVKRKIEQRNAQRIQEYINIAPDISPYSKHIANQNADKLARIAKRRNVNIEVRNGDGNFKYLPQINIYKRTTDNSNPTNPDNLITKVLMPDDDNYLGGVIHRGINLANSKSYRMIDFLVSC
jgi:hypothetical protein